MGNSLLLFTTTGIPLMVILLLLVSISSGVALCNTNKWASADVCCNLMRSRRAARCTRSCSGSKHCCARLSNTHIGASVLTGLVLVLYLVALFFDCHQAAQNRADYEHDMRTRESESRYPRNYDNYFAYISRGHHCEICVLAPPNRTVRARGCGPASRKDGDTDRSVGTVCAPYNGQRER